MAKPSGPLQPNDVEFMLRALLTQSLAGDNTAYRQFLEKLADHLRRFLHKRLYRVQDDIEDLTIVAFRRR